MKRISLLIGMMMLASAARGGSADLQVMQSDAPDPAVVGSSITLTVVLLNNGPDGASDVMLSASLPTGVKFQSIEAPSDFACTSPPADTTGSITCSVRSLPSGGNSSVVINVKAVIAGVASSEASVTASEPDPNPQNNTAAEETTILPVDISMRLGFNKRGSVN